MLDLRLKTVYELIDEGMIVADIGTDHAFLPIELVLNNKCDLVYACDDKDGPLKIALKNIKEYGLEDKIIPVKSNGLNKVNDDVTTVVIAGMGYHSAKSILENDLPRLSNFKQIIVQVNNDINLLRRWISSHHFKIVNEKMVKVKHYYTIIEFNTSYHEGLSEVEMEFGPVLLKERDTCFLDYLNVQFNKYNNLYQLINDEAKKKELSVKIEQIKSILENKEY